MTEDASGATEGKSPDVGVFGGTFDPPHIGHLALASEVRHRLGLEEVIFVVAGRPWQKEGWGSITPARHRLEMVRRAVAGVAGMSVSGIEMERPGASYTADTLDEMHEADPTARLHLVVGADVAAGLSTWERLDEVLRRCRLVVVNRAGHPPPAIPPHWDAVQVEMPPIDLSSTELRRRVAAGDPCDFLVPAPVLAYVAAEGLYRESAPAPGPGSG